MDFWDRFIKLENYNNAKTCTSLLKENFEQEEIDETINCMVYDDFIDLNSYSKKEFLLDYGLFQYIEEDEEIGPPEVYIYLRFYYNIFRSLAAAASQMQMAFDIKIGFIEEDTTAEANYQISKMLGEEKDKKVEPKKVSKLLALLPNKTIYVFYMLDFIPMDIEDED